MYELPLDYRLYPEAREALTRYLNALCDHERAHPGVPPPPEVVALAEEYSFQRCQSRDRRDIGRRFRLPTNAEQRYYNTDAIRRDRQTPDGRERHRIAAAKWRDENRELKRALDRLYYYRKRAQRRIEGH